VILEPLCAHTIYQAFIFDIYRETLGHAIKLKYSILIYLNWNRTIGIVLALIILCAKLQNYSTFRNNMKYKSDQTNTVLLYWNKINTTKLQSTSTNS
jgi:hypothetical protein